MRIAIDILSAALGGPGQYLLRLLPPLAARGAQHRFHVLAAHPELIRRLPSPPGVTVHAIPAGRRAATRLLWQRFVMPAWLRRHAIDVLFVPQGLTALRGGPPLVVLHQDAMYLCRERFGRSRLYVALQHGFARRTLRRAAGALFVSRAIWELADSRGWLRPEVSRIIPHGVDVDDLMPSPSAPDAELPYVLTVGSVMPHKNVLTLIEALAILRRRGRADVRLRIVGEAPRSRPCVRQLRRRIEAEKLTGAVEVIGTVDRPALGRHYRGARLYVSLSRLESFGFTPLEAMGCGAAVLCNDLPVFRETCGDAAEYADATNAACVADAIESLWDDEPRRRELIRRGRERYARFRWTDVADAVLAALTDAARGRA